MKDGARRLLKCNKNHKDNENSENDKSNKSAQYLQTTSVSLLGRCTWIFWKKIFYCYNCMDLGIFVTFLLTHSGFVSFGTFSPFFLPWIAIFVLFRYIFSLVSLYLWGPLDPSVNKHLFLIFHFCALICCCFRHFSDLVLLISDSCDSLHFWT